LTQSQRKHTWDRRVRLRYGDLVIVLGDRVDGGNDDAPVRGVESDRRLDLGQVVAEVARVGGEELGKESEPIALEGLRVIG
jgi:hypothetical protein